MKTVLVVVTGTTKNIRIKFAKILKFSMRILVLVI